jgi:hypothetical protein
MTNTTVFDALARRIIELAPRLSSAVLANLAWSFAQLQRRPGACFAYEPPAGDTSVGIKASAFVPCRPTLVMADCFFNLYTK